MIPDGTAVERVGSALVDTFTSPDTCATPMVKPESVIVTASLIVEAPRVIVKVAEGLKPKVTVALHLPATRSAAGIEKEGRVTCEVAVVVKYIPNRMTRLRVTFILRFCD